MRRQAKKIRQRITAGKPKTTQSNRPVTLTGWKNKYLSHHITCKSAPFHEWVESELDRISVNGERNQRVNILAPRGSAKSTEATFVLPLREALEGREPFIVIASDSREQAIDFLSQIKEEIETNELLAQDYSESAGKGPVWRGQRITLRNGVEIRAYSSKSRIRGAKTRKNKRPSLVILDDVENKDHAHSPLQRGRLWNWLTKDVMSAGAPGTNFVCVGTSHHREGLTCRLALPSSGWKSRIWRSLGSHVNYNGEPNPFDPLPLRMDLWAEWENILFDHRTADGPAKARAYYDANAVEMNRGHDTETGKVRVFWPERYSLYDLMTKRAMDGKAAFNSEQMNDPVDPSACEFDSEYFLHAAFWFDDWPDDLAVKVVSLDPSKGNLDKPGDYQAIIKYGIRLENGHIIEYVEGDLRRCGIEELCAATMQLCKDFDPNTLAVEGVLFQSLLSIPLGIAAKDIQTACHLTMVNQGNIPKPVRIRRLASALAQRRLRCKARSAGTMLLVNQLKDFPTGEHDDGPDALEIAEREAIQIWNGMPRR